MGLLFSTAGILGNPRWLLTTLIRFISLSSDRSPTTLIPPLLLNPIKCWISNSADDSLACRYSLSSFIRLFNVRLLSNSAFSYFIVFISYSSLLMTVRGCWMGDVEIIRRLFYRLRISIARRSYSRRLLLVSSRMVIRRYRSYIF